MNNLFTFDKNNPDFIEKLEMDETVSSKTTKSTNPADPADEFCLTHNRKSKVRKRRRTTRKYKTAERNKNKGTVPYYHHDIRVDNLYFREKSSEKVNNLINRGMNDYFDELEDKTVA